MQTDKELIREIVQTGKLKTYSQDASFLNVYWQIPEQAKGTYYLFRFTALNLDLIDVHPICPQIVPIAHKPKVMRPIIEKLVRDLNVWKPQKLSTSQFFIHSFIHKACRSFGKTENFPQNQLKYRGFGGVLQNVKKGVFQLRLATKIKRKKRAKKYSRVPHVQERIQVCEEKGRKKVILHSLNLWN